MSPQHRMGMPRCFCGGKTPHCNANYIRAALGRLIKHHTPWMKVVITDTSSAVPHEGYGKLQLTLARRTLTSAGFEVSGPYLDTRMHQVLRVTFCRPHNVGVKLHAYIEVSYGRAQHETSNT